MQHQKKSTKLKMIPTSTTNMLRELAEQHHANQMDMSDDTTPPPTGPRDPTTSSAPPAMNDDPEPSGAITHCSNFSAGNRDLTALQLQVTPSREENRRILEIHTRIQRRPQENQRTLVGLELPIHNCLSKVSPWDLSPCWSRPSTPN